RENISELSIVTDEITTWSYIRFDSYPSDVGFIGDRREDFPINTTVRFSFQVKKYDLPSGGLTITVEHFYALDILQTYLIMMGTEMFTPITFAKNFSENYTQCKLTITNMTHALLPPLRWSDINISLHQVNDGNLSSPEIGIYTAENELIGTIGKTKNIPNDKLLAIGQYLQFAYFPEYNSTELVFFPSHEVLDPVFLPVLSVVPLSHP
ncbi:MAG: hypothetical protein AB1485_06545, partial [Candidatus Thermoplasmatota archaeon]